MKSESVKIIGKDYDHCNYIFFENKRVFFASLSASKSSAKISDITVIPLIVIKLHSQRVLFVRGQAPKAQGRGSNFFQQGGLIFQNRRGARGVPSKIFSQIS